MDAPSRHKGLRTPGSTSATPHRQLANRSQRMILRHTLLQGNITEHPVLNPLVSTHTA